MARARISTTVDATLLERCRRLVGQRDASLLDQALAALHRELTAEREREALRRLPYEQDPELAWDAEPAPALPYDGAVPPEVLALARNRRQTWP